ncbi:WhiB family transcription factor [Gordonia phage Guey18]|nr:WhiB family transcription factor [Gordonia phage Guey18]
MSSWWARAKCRGMEPHLFDIESLTPGKELEEARELCRGCHVKRECAADALIPIDVSKALGLLGESDQVPHSGVVRAGIPIGLIEE